MSLSSETAARQVATLQREHTERERESESERERERNMKVENYKDYEDYIDSGTAGGTHIALTQWPIVLQPQ